MKLKKSVVDWRNWEEILATLINMVLVLVVVGFGVEVEVGVEVGVVVLVHLLRVGLGVVEAVVSV